MSDIKDRTQQAIELTKRLKSQSPLKIMPGLTVRRTKGGILVVRLHYSADPDRDPEINPLWKQEERKTYTSQAAWDREQEIMDEAGGGELVFADVLVSHWDKIVIRDPAWRPDPRWHCEAGFDHGKTNATVLLRCYIDHEGVIYFAGEYYVPGKEVWEHARDMRQMAGITHIRVCYADPTIFDDNMQQSQLPGKPAERAKSVNELYCEKPNNIQLFSKFIGDRLDVSFAARLMMHWANLDKRKPTVRIVCRNYSEKPQPGLHNWDCPNLLWELMRCRREKLTAQQLLTRNASEKIVDKDNHARDAMKYVIMSHPEPTVKSFQERAQETTQPLAQARDLTSAYVRYRQMEDNRDENDNEDYVRLGEHFPMQQESHFSRVDVNRMLNRRRF